MIREIKRKYLPYPIRQGLKYVAGMVPFSIRYGRTFQKTYKLLEESQWWDKKTIEEYQFAELQKIIGHAYENVPYYRKILDECGVRHGSIQSLEDIGKIPYLTKEDIRQNVDELLAKNYPESSRQYVTTGGTTGLPLGFFQERDKTAQKEWAFTWRHWAWVGVKPNDKRVVLRGNRTERHRWAKENWWMFDPRENALFLSSFLMSKQNCFKYIEMIKRCRPTVIQAYPSSLYLLTTFMVQNDLRIEPVKCILTSSEVLYQRQRELIEGVFNTKIFDHYGNAERNAAIMQCERGNYHIIPEYSYLEFVPKNDKSCMEEGDQVEIVGTSFNNYVMPFIRYKTGDIAVYSERECNCGRHFGIVERIEGRKQDYFVDRSGVEITFTCSDECLWGVKEKIAAYQYVQEEPGKVILNIEGENQLSFYDLEKIRVGFLSKYSSFEIEVRQVEAIPRTNSGKFRFLVQKLPVMDNGKPKVAHE